MATKNQSQPKAKTPEPEVKVPNYNTATNKAGLFSIPFHKNIMLVLVLLIVLFIIRKQVGGYIFVFDNLIAQNMKMIKEKPNLTNVEKGMFKFQYDYEYIDYVKNHTPENAVILFPDPEVILKDSTPDYPKFRITGGGVYTQLWDEYFLYPRKVLFARQLKDSKLAKSITHVAVVNYKGYDYLTYPVANKSRLGVYSVNISTSK